MPYANAPDGVRLYYETAGKGTPIVFVHEYSGDYRSWEAQMRYFARRYRCVAFCARGYPPSDVPSSRASYSQKTVTDDVAVVMRELEMRKAHVVGCSMGAATALQFGIRHAARVLSITTVGVGSGSDPRRRREYLKKNEANAKTLDALGMPAAVRAIGLNPGRIAQQNKDPRGFAEFRRWQEQHSARGLANTLREIQAKRPTIYDLAPALKRMKLPLFVTCGDEDDNCLPPSIFIKEVCPTARLWVCPGAGHTVNTEEPELFNRALGDFLALVDSGRWRPRDPRSVVPTC